MNSYRIALKALLCAESRETRRKALKRFQTESDLRTKTQETALGSIFGTQATCWPPKDQNRLKRR